MYEIQSKSDFQTGAVLIVRIPEEEVDKKALYTVISEQPDFLLPFRHRSIDGQIEFTYQIGSRSKLAYLSGSRSPDEYAELWLAVLQPLLDCGDWFMTPFSFVLKPEYLYCDKNGKTVSFIYIPSIKPCSDHNELKYMVTNIAKQNHVTDVSIENKVVWAIQDFNPVEFLQMIKTFKTNNEQKLFGSVKAAEEKQKYIQPEAQMVKRSEPKEEISTPMISSMQKSDEIMIQLPTGGKTAKTEKPEKPKGGLFGTKKEKEPKPPKEAKPPKEPKEKKGLFGKKKESQQEIMQGAALLPQQDEYIQELAIAETEEDVTQLEIYETDAPKFRYLGSGEYPRVIEIDITDGFVFTIGRFDATVGTRQSSFEFDKKTKAVSRRHAAVERSGNEYIIVDLNSAAGTFMNGQKMPPNTPLKLEQGCRVSFGHSGADYIWEG